MCDGYREDGVHSEGLNKWRPVRIIIIPVFEMLTLRSGEEIFTIIEVVPVFKERINFSEIGAVRIPAAVFEATILKYLSQGSHFLS